MKYRLYAGTINHHESDDEWINEHADVSDRGIHSVARGAFVEPEFVVDLGNNVDMRRTLTSDRYHEVVCHHVLEHMFPDQADEALLQFYRILAPGGVLDIEVPDFDKVAQAWLDDDMSWDSLHQWVYGEQLPNHEPGDTHKSAYNVRRLGDILVIAGFDVGEPIEAGWAARYRAVKP